MQAKDLPSDMSLCLPSRMRRNNQLSSLPEGRIGTFDLCAPEILMGGRVCEKADLYSFGVILAEIITGAVRLPPFSCPLSNHCYGL